MDTDRVLGALLGTAVGDALAMPIDGLSHQNVRTYYKGIKAYRADEHHRDLGAGQWTGLTQRTFALVRVLAELSSHATVRTRYVEEVKRLDLRRPEAAGPSEAIVAITPLAVWWSHEGRTDRETVELVDAALEDRYEGGVVAAAVGQAVAVRHLLASTPARLDGPAFFQAVTERTRQAEERLGSSRAVSDRLRTLADHLSDFPLDLQDLCDGTGPAADEAWPFAVAMVARNPELLEATVLPAINVGGAASVIGTCVGALVGALHGWAAFPAEWREELEDAVRLEAEATAFAAALD
jgi:ADP-ribosylglycohydrolase